MPQRVNRWWAAIVLLIALDFITTYIGITGGYVVERNIFLAPLTASGQWGPVALFLMMTAFQLYGMWNFFDRRPLLLKIYLASYAFLVTSNTALILLAL